MNIKRFLIITTAVFCLSTATIYSLDLKDMNVMSNITSEQLKEVVPKNMKTLTQDIVYYSKLYGVNELFLTSVIRLESGNNTSNLAQDRNNVGGVKNKKGQYASFSTKSDCIEYMAKLLSEEYLTKEGKYYSGTTIKDVCEYYNCGDEYWTEQISSMTTKMYNDVQNLK